MSASTVGFHEYPIDLGDAQVWARVGGEGPLMVFLHGITANRMIWLPVLEALAADFLTVAIDQRGHGETVAPRGAYAADDFARDVERLITALGEERAIVVGHSLGARNALVAAAAARSTVDAVIAIEFTPFIDSAIFDALEERVHGGSRAFASLDEITTYLRARYPRLPDDAIRRRAEHGFTRDGAKLRPKADGDAMAETARGLREDISPAVGQIAAPALIIRGAESTFVTAHAFEATKELRPDFRTLVIDGTDHYVPEEAPHEVASAIRAFVEASL